MSSRRVNAALGALGRKVTSAVPELEGRVRLGMPGQPDAEDYPSLALVPAFLRFEPNQEREHDASAATFLVEEVGLYTGTLQMRLSAQSRPERELMEEAIFDLFFQVPGRRGVLVAEMPDYYDARASFELEGKNWTDEMVFSLVRDSMLELRMNVPFLLKRAGVFTIEDLRLAITHDLGSDVPEETVKIAADGTITVVA